MKQYADLIAERKGIGIVFQAFCTQPFFELEIEVGTGEHLREYGSDCGTNDAEGKKAYQKQIQSNVGKGGNGNCAQRPFAVAHASHNTGLKLVYGREGNSDAHQLKISFGAIVNLRRSMCQRQNCIGA